jgi:hypothetical protein
MEKEAPRLRSAPMSFDPSTSLRTLRTSPDLTGKKEALSFAVKVLRIMLLTAYK